MTSSKKFYPSPMSVSNSRNLPSLGQILANPPLPSLLTDSDACKYSQWRNTSKSCIEIADTFFWESPSMKVACSMVSNLQEKFSTNRLWDYAYSESAIHVWWMPIHLIPSLNSFSYSNLRIAKPSWSRLSLPSDVHNKPCFWWNNHDCIARCFGVIVHR